MLFINITMMHQVKMEKENIKTEANFPLYTNHESGL